MPELRKDPIVNRWVIISSERGRRPGAFSERDERKPPDHCPFCEGNETETPPEIWAERSKGSKADGPGWSLRVIPNKFPALTSSGTAEVRGDDLFEAMDGRGAHEVVIEGPDHMIDLAHRPRQQFERILRVYRDRLAALNADPKHASVLVFKNHRFRAGASLDHPHTQIIAMPILPQLMGRELHGCAIYHAEHKRCPFCDMAKRESEAKERIVAENDDFIAICPYASRFPFEMWVLPKAHASQFEAMTDAELSRFAPFFQGVLLRLEVGVGDPPYNFMIHSAPLREPKAERYHWHIEITPRLTRLAGFEHGTGFYINPTSPEACAELLREAKLD